MISNDIEIVIEDEPRKDLSFFIDKFEKVSPTKKAEDAIESYIRNIERDIESKGEGTKEQAECLSFLYSVKTKVVSTINQPKKR